jgi:membrane carboxypeptidase/penicillin-binding protein PbpC
VAPLNGSVFIRNPEQPPGLTFLPLRLSADSAAQQVIWYVDGRPYQTADAKETVRWRVEPGRHSFEARLAQGDGVGAPVEVTVR